MEHDGKCEQNELVREIQRRMNATAYEVSVLKQTDFCYCSGRARFGMMGLEMGVSTRVDKIAFGVKQVVKLRIKDTKVILDIPYAEVELRALKMAYGDGLWGKVIPVDFQARRRIVD